MSRASSREPAAESSFTAGHAARRLSSSLPSTDGAVGMTGSCCCTAGSAGTIGLGFGFGTATTWPLSFGCRLTSRSGAKAPLGRGGFSCGVDGADLTVPVAFPTRLPVRTFRCWPNGDAISPTAILLRRALMTRLARTRSATPMTDGRRGRQESSAGRCRRTRKTKGGVWRFCCWRCRGPQATAVAHGAAPTATAGCTTQPSCRLPHPM